MKALSGSITALITPFSNGQIDEKALQRLVEWQITEGTSALVVCGTTGESPTVSHDEHKMLIDIVVKTTKKRIPIIAGTGSNSTNEAIELTKYAQKAGCDYAMIVTPYYNKPSQDGIYAHFEAISKSVDLPIIIYNIPGRCGVDIAVETVGRLSSIPGVIGIKEATGQVLRYLHHSFHVPDDFIQLCGDDSMAVAAAAHGAIGCISVTANILPKKCAELQRLLLAGKFSEALHLQNKLMMIHDVLFLESNPVPVKYAASLLGLCDFEVRLPLVQVTRATANKIRSALVRFGLIDV